MKVWMKVIDHYDRVTWVGVEHDTIVTTKGYWSALQGSRADDTLSRLSIHGWKVEGPFDEPE